MQTLIFVVTSGDGNGLRNELDRTLAVPLTVCIRGLHTGFRNWRCNFVEIQGTNSVTRWTLAVSFAVCVGGTLRTKDQD